MGLDPLTIGIASLVAGAYQSNQQNHAQRQAAADAKDAALKTEAQAQEAANRANQKAPDVADLLKANTGKGAASGTMLTGPMGVDPNALALGKNTLLGQ